MNLQTLLLEKSCLEISHRALRCVTWLSFRTGMSRGVRELSTLRGGGGSSGGGEGGGGGKALPLFAQRLRAGYLSLQQAATRLLHLIVSSAHSR